MTIIIAFGAFKIFKWRAYQWLPGLLRESLAQTPEDSGTQHVIFICVDHYEPGRGDKGVANNRDWLKQYRDLADRHRDSYGRKPQHTWFYAYDHRNDGVMRDLARAVHEGYGEIEFHWHHGNDTNETLRNKLAEALTWFNSYGAMVAEEGKVSFGFIHGNWALDNSGKREHCGVNWELDILKQGGCYADFTFPALGNVAQPQKINSIYYARDNDQAKSYETGQEAAVGRRGDGLMIFQGPLGIRFNRQLFECGAVETDYEPTPARVDDWIARKIGVKGRPEWIFVKVYTHGIQGSQVFFSQDTDRMFNYLEEKYGRDRYRLHYVTAREAYNIVRAAEDGQAGDPDQYRNYQIGEPLNKRKRVQP